VRILAGKLSLSTPARHFFGGCALACRFAAWRLRLTRKLSK